MVDIAWPRAGGECLFVFRRGWSTVEIPRQGCLGDLLQIWWSLVTYVSPRGTFSFDRVHNLARLQERDLVPRFHHQFRGQPGYSGASIPGCMRFGLSGTLGFKIAEPSGDILQVGATVNVAGAIVVGKPGKGVKIKAGLGFKILPKPDIPYGFAVSFSAGPKTKAQQNLQKLRENVMGCSSINYKAAALLEEEEKEGVSLEDSLYRAVGRSIKAHLDHDYEDMFESGQFMAAMEIGASAMGNMKGRNTGLPPIAPDELTLSAGLAIAFCITCFPGIRPANDGTVMSDPYKDGYSKHAFAR